MSRQDYKKAIEAINNEIKRLEELRKTNPELAKKIARESLQRAGILDKDGKLAPPYNGQNVHKDDFTRGPKAFKKEDNFER